MAHRFSRRSRRLGFSSRRRFPNRTRGNGADLLQQAQCVPSSVRIQNLSIFEVVNCDAFHRYFLAGRGNTHEFTLMRATKGPAGNQLFPFGDRVFNRET